MATINSNLTITGTGTTSDKLNITKLAALSVASPTVQVGTTLLTTTFTSAIPNLNGVLNTTDTFLYVLNSSSGIEVLEIRFLASQTEVNAGNCDGCDLIQGPGLSLRKDEYAFIPLTALAHVEFRGSVDNTQLEYGYWSRAL